MTISSFVNGFRKFFGDKKKVKIESRLARFDDHVCPKCGNDSFSYDSYWRESCCTQCGWTVQGNKTTKKEKFESRLARFDDHVCPKCGNNSFSYDSYWRESCCTQCGWTVQGNKATKKENMQNDLVVNQLSKNHVREDLNNDNRFSHSRISLFKNCPKAYHFKYLLKKDELFSSIELHLGKSIHVALEKAYIQKNEVGNVSINSLKIAFEHAWDNLEKENVRVIKKSMNSKDCYIDGIQMLENYYHRVFESDHSDTIALEKYFEIIIDNSICYRGVIDRISKNQNGTLRITDFKSGKRVNDPLEDMQLCSYALWCFEKFNVNEIEVAFEALRHNKTLCRKIKKSQIPLIKKKLMDDINTILSAKEFEAIPSFLCAWCGYNPICPEAKVLPSFRYPKYYNGDSDKCPICGGELEEKNGRYGFFIGCSEYPDCRYTRDER